MERLEKPEGLHQVLPFSASRWTILSTLGVQFFSLLGLADIFPRHKKGNIAIKTF
jgi:hypothetical protein